MTDSIYGIPIIVDETLKPGEWRLVQPIDAPAKIDWDDIWKRGSFTAATIMTKDCFVQRYSIDLVASSTGQREEDDVQI